MECKTYKIDKNIPVVVRLQANEEILNTVKIMEINDSFFIAYSEKLFPKNLKYPSSKIRNIIDSFQSTKRLDTSYVYTIHTVKENGINGVRVWRIK